MSGMEAMPAGLPARFRVTGQLGRGGMGQVVEAADPQMGRRVAIKIIRSPAPDDAEGLAGFRRFRREAQMAGALSHDHVVRVFDFGEDPSAAWMVMEIVEGGTLRELISAAEPLALAQTIRLMVQILDGLAHCHDQGIVHGDLKPANVMLTERSAAGEVKLADFGIAQRHGEIADDPADDRTLILGPGNRASAGLVGTPAYMAPEQFLGGTLDARTDIWAAGVVLHEMLTREKPFQGTLDQVRAKVLTGTPTPPSHLSVVATPALDAIVARAMARSPKDRYADARGFAAALLEAERSKRPAPLAAALSSAQPGASAKPGLTTPRWLLPAGGAAACLLVVAGFLLTRAPAIAPPPPALAAMIALPPLAPPVVPLLVPDPAIEQRARQAGLETAAEALVAGLRCGIVQARVESDIVTLTGFLPQADAAALEAGVVAAGGTPRASLDLFDAPFCAVLTAIRPALMPPSEPPALAARPRRLRGGETLTLDMTLPEWTSRMSLWFVMHDGQALRLIHDARTTPGERRTMRDSGPNFPWTIGPPFGLEMVLMMLSEAPLFATPRPGEEPTASLAAALETAIGQARQRGTRVQGHAIMIETLAP